ncbi:MAG: sulfatase-like hydrolase/transferase [Gammaproteobacteria bacterium]|nr:sulfatase-like hydrolase/transferase [Gammaproteobacteria bacterium]
MRERPNVLFVITDQQRADHTGFMGNETLETPNLDNLAASGMVFENAWVSNPVCMPNRCTMMTGRMPSAHGVIFNDRSLERDVNTFVRRFQGSGYRTGLIGKSHLQHGMSRNAVVPFRGEPSGTLPFPDGWDRIEDSERYLDGNPDDPADFYGFDHVEFSIDHGPSVAGHHLRWALDRGGRREDLVIDLDAPAPGSDRSAHWRQIYRPPYPEELHSTAFVAERTLAFIEAAEAAGEPWLAWCSFPDPHHPMTPPGKWFDRYRPEDMLLPETRHDPLDGAPAHLRHFAGIHPRDQRNWVSPCGFGEDALLREAIAATYGMIGMVDDAVGQVLRRLDELGVREDTIVVFTSDHGDMMGDHRLFLKGFMHYRGTLQVPMVIDAPGCPAGRTSALASSIAPPPTLLDVWGRGGYAGIPATSRAPALSVGGAAVRERVLIEDDVPVVLSRLTPIPARTRTVLADGYRYTRNAKGEEQLFDLGADPDEMHDVRDRRDARGRMLEALADAMMLADDSSRGAPATDARAQ